MTTERDLSKLTVGELFDYLIDCLKRNKRKKPIKALLQAMKKKGETN